MAAVALDSETKSPEVQWRCMKCLAVNERKVGMGEVGPWTCAECGESEPARPEAIDEAGRLASCPVCGCPDLYRHRDFNHKLGLAILVAGGILAWFIGFWVLVVFALVDFAVYFAIPNLVACYHCQAILRGFPGSERVAPFDLNISDKYIEIERERGW